MNEVMLMILIFPPLLYFAPGTADIPCLPSIHTAMGVPSVFERPSRHPATDVNPWR